MIPLNSVFTFAEEVMWQHFSVCCFDYWKNDLKSSKKDFNDNFDNGSRQGINNYIVVLFLISEGL